LKSLNDAEICVVASEVKNSKYVPVILIDGPNCGVSALSPITPWKK
jgi:hypothetical protein